MSASTGPDLELSEKLLKILNLQADTALTEAQLRNQQAQLDLQSANLHADTALKEAQLRAQPPNLQADSALKMRQRRGSLGRRWRSPWRLGAPWWAD